MSSLAEATAALRKKDAERTAIVERIRSLEETKDDGFSGTLRLSVVDIPGVDIRAEADIKLSINPEEAGVKTSEEKREETVFNLKTKDVIVHFEVTVTPVATAGEDDAEPQPAVTFTAEFDVKELDDEGDAKAEIVGTTAKGNEKTFSIKAAYEDIEVALAQANKDREEIQQQITELGVAVKEASRQSQSQSQGGAGAAAAAGGSKAGGGGGAGKPLKKKSSKKSGGVVFADSVGDDSEGASSIGGPALTERLAQGSQLALMFAVQNRAYFIFALGAAAIYSFGDMASI